MTTMYMFQPEIQVMFMKEMLYQYGDNARNGVMSLTQKTGIKRAIAVT